ncbi:hypothetical protein QBC41DRAFT_327825 [Cercophora samala]|uniref:DUF7730 domain-containing protein n=1 Tax=Cercophora samala TaxID=330535 RepID=A0AA39Z8G9_9PEZI|nr:hypothetical protein QBC41DRAFT_327825 [Cercophora samala]
MPSQLPIHDRATTLLHLSPKTRRRIYRFMGVAAHGHVAKSLVFNLHRMEKKEKQHLGFHGLLLSCRTIYSEVASLLYSENIFVIHSSRHAGPFDPLLALTNTALASLTCLKVVLNQTSCHQETSRGDSVTDCCLVTDEPLGAGRSWCERNHGKLHQPAALSNTDLSSLSLLMQWEAAANHLSGISEGRMTLFFVCDVEHEDVEAGRLAVAPLLRLPRLKGCHIRLAKRPDWQLQRLAHDTVQKCLGLPPLRRLPASDTASPRAFLDLPRELRLRILGFTDLVTPIREVSWDGQVYRVNRPTHSMTHHAGYNNDLSVSCRRDHHLGCRFSNCWFERTTPGNYQPGCFCRLMHTAVSSHCRCWAPPTHLFLVCRALYCEAQHVFFSANRFIVHDYGDMLDPSIVPSLPWVDSYPNARLTASRFLRDQVPASSLRSLRFLELVFPAYMHPSWPSNPDHSAIADWIDTVEYIKDKINGPGLTLRVIMASSVGTAPVGHDRLTAEQGRQIERGYHNILGPLARLQDGLCGPLHRFYAHLAYPWAYTEDTIAMIWPDAKKYHTFIQSHEKRLKQEAERMVLGDDRYRKQTSYNTRAGNHEVAESPTVDDENVQYSSIDYFHQVSTEVLNKPLEDWEREEREGQEPRSSYWHFCHEVMRLRG